MNDAQGHARPGRTSERSILAYDVSGAHQRYDDLVTEEPLELRLRAGLTRTTLAVTMRTPGNDFELAAGFVFNESIIHEYHDIAAIGYCLDDELTPDQQYNVVNIDLRATTLPNVDRFERHFTMTSACGVCGRAVLKRLEDLGVTPIPADHMRVNLSTIHGLAHTLRAAQTIFERTGGLHAAALFSPDGKMLAVREDIGRHNALDKLIGWALMERRTPLENTILFVSGRSSYEILQKAAVARIPVVASVSAPSSLAVDLARNYNITLLGFVRDGRANCYWGPERIIPS